MNYTDEIIIHTRSINDWNEATGTSATVRARVEKTDKILQTVEGQAVQSSWFIGLPPGAAITKSDFVQISKLRGVDYDDGQIRPVLSLHFAGGFSVSHIEVMV